MRLQTVPQEDIGRERRAVRSSGNFVLKATALRDVWVVVSQVFRDDRGIFLESYNQKDFENLGIETQFVQDNMSSSKKGVLRGLHYQLVPSQQSKLIRVLRGEIYDVAVDIRRDSPTFGCWAAEELSAENQKMMYIPEGYAHGYYVLSQRVEILYKVSAFYDPRRERGILWNDPQLNIAWPEMASQPVLSPKDQKFPSFKNAEFP
jgi:dTDP-4-dehydrorhamnose 3,5-epimerase